MRMFWALQRSFGGRGWFEIRGGHRMKAYSRHIPGMAIMNMEYTIAGLDFLVLVMLSFRL